jgi:hypothetical protein
MKEMIKILLRAGFNVMPDSIKNIYFERLRKKSIKHQQDRHRVKQLAIQYYQKKYNINILVETGTYLGDMVWAQKNYFKKIFSIELGVELWENAVKRFKDYSSITILKGDSGKILNEVIPLLDEIAIFWLDGHYSAGITAKGDKECPIFEELEAIFKSNFSHILLIDDAMYFNGTADYPTMKELERFVLVNRPESIIKVKDDIIRVVIVNTQE